MSLPFKEKVSANDKDAAKALTEYYGTTKVERAVVDGQKGYSVTLPNGIKCFHYRLSSAFRQIMGCLGHGDDRDILIAGEPLEGNAWDVK